MNQFFEELFAFPRKAKKERVSQRVAEFFNDIELWNSQGGEQQDLKLCLSDFLPLLVIAEIFWSEEK